MTKHTVITMLGAVIVVVAVGGFPPGFIKTSLLVMSGIAISVLSYLSSVVYCSNCKKLIEDVDQSFAGSPEILEKKTVATPKIQ